MTNTQVWVATIIFASAASSCGSVNTALLLSSYEAVDDSPSDFWCGNVSRGGRNAACFGKSTTATGGIPARKVEVRGWIVGGPFFKENENEYIIALLLDHSWTPASPAAEHADPLNTLAKINAALTPHNVVAFGNGPAGEATAWLDEGVWGGPRSLVLHVEVNGWGNSPARPASAGMDAFPGTDSDRRRDMPPPAGWKISDSTPGVAWAVDPFQPPTVPGRTVGLADGDYVRMVGLLWEDEPHVGSEEGRAGEDADRTIDGKECWNTGQHKGEGVGRGYAELHPVDYLVELDRPERTDTVFAVVMCGESSLRREVVPPGPRPAGANAVCETYIDAAFSEVGSLGVERCDSLGDRVVIRVTVRDSGRREPKFKAIYRVFWQS